ncbi:MAG: dihydrodipicolinate synthase family protein [Phycisphaeraceae bacterium]|nr:dihydrodipicolinate synthase family protein [Phycisphaeraceae bacterium]
MTVRIIAAIGTPLTPDERLHVDGLSLQLERLWAAGIHGIFAAGTLGVMPMLTDDTYRELIEKAVHLVQGRGELFVGASDQSLARTQQRIAYINQFKVDGVVALPPFFMRFSQQELIGYYRALAEASRAPVYLYDLPQRTHLSLDNRTVLTLAEHPNIVGIKCSGPIEQARQLIDQLARREIRFRVVVAQPDHLHNLVEDGVTDHLDGIYTLAPRWTVQIAQTPSSSNREGIRQLQTDLIELRDVMRRHGSLSAFTVLMNACGVPGCYAPQPFRKLTPTEIDALFEQPVVQKFLAAEAFVSANV